MKSKIKKTIAILLVVCFLASATVMSASACTLRSSVFKNDWTMQQICAGNRLMQYGDNYQSVKLVQNTLMRLGYSIPAGATGYFGPQTKAAVIKYQTAHSYVLAADGIIGPKTLNELDYDIDIIDETPSTTTITTTPPSTIRVLITKTGQIKTVAFKDYVENVLPNEWYASWNLEALKAGAMATKTYAWYWTIHNKYPGKGYDVKDSTADQVYKPGTATSSTNQAVEETWNKVMTKNGRIFQAQYDSGTSGSPNPLYAGRLSQWGTQYWAQKGKDWQWMLHNYYDPISIT